jgi:hypothetical protein
MKLAWIRSNHILHIGAKARKCVGCRCMTLLRFSFTQKLMRPVGTGDNQYHWFATLSKGES